MDEPILRATDATGETYDDPSEDALFMFMEDLKSPGSSFRVDRLEEGRQDEWAQISLNKISLYEFQSSENVNHVSSLRAVHEFLTLWAFDLFDAD